MSRRLPPKTSSREQVTKRPSATRSQASSKPSTISGRPSNVSAKGSNVSAKASTASTKAGAKPSTSTTKEKKEFSLPALSLTYKAKVTGSELEKLKRKTIRRNAPPGEDLKQIREILKTIKGRDITVQEFISLIAPSTGDRGEVLRSVMQDDLNSFRKLARKVYDTITQDNSDVIQNQQLQLSEYYKEKKQLLQDKMMRRIDEIYSMAPTFSFDRYAAEGEKYLLELFPIPEEINIEPEEFEMMKRQAAYHRLQWLRSEGERLNEENNSLKNRLNQLKRMHQEEQIRMMQMEKAAEAKKEALEAQQAQKFETLEKLNDSLEKTIIEKESNIREKKDRVLREPSSSKTELKKKKSKGAVKKRKPSWNEQAAREIEAKILEKSHAADVATATGARSPFHFSPIKTPPSKTSAPKEASPFHYSPPKSPRGASYVPPQSATAPASQLPQSRTQLPQSRIGRRPSQGPRDSWGGFY